MKKSPHKKKKKEEKNVQLPTEKNSQRPSKKFFCSATFVLFDDNRCEVNKNDRG